MSTCANDRALVLIAVLAGSCGGRTSPPGRSPSQGPIPTDLAFAPAPRLRVGISTRAELVRLTSSSPFHVRAPGMLLDTTDVIVEPERGESPEGWTYRVQVASFPDERSAVDYRARLRDEMEEEVTLGREPGSGRFTLSVGSFSTESGAEPRRAELERMGFESTQVVRERAGSNRPRGLWLRAMGREAVRTDSLQLQVFPGARGGFLEIDGAPYRGNLEIHVNPSNRLTVVNIVNLEDYLRGVVPAELSPTVFPEKEALKAQSVAARTYALKRRGEYADEGFDICATPACQVYQGVSVEHPLSDEAVTETEGEFLTYDGEPIDALYTSTCGGRTENSENVFTTSAPYLVSRACALERRPFELVARNPGPLPVEAALLRVLGIDDGAEPLTVSGLQRLVARTLAYMGQRNCLESNSSDGAVDIVALASTLAEGLCWGGRTSILMSAPEAEKVVGVPGLSDSERRQLAFAIREGLVRPPPTGIVRGQTLSRGEVLATLHRLIVTRGEAPLRSASVESATRDAIVLKGEQEEDPRTAVIGPETYLYHRVGEAIFYEPSVVLLPNDPVWFHQGTGGIDVLVVGSDGASFDRSSRFSHWVVRKSTEELTRDVNARHRVGEVIELKPLRYGLSGRIAELEIVGRVASATVKGLAIRRALGLRENLFFFDSQLSPDGTVRGWVFTGRGWGHGVGLCQVGAYGMAAAGYDHAEILAHYYAGSELRVDKGGRPP
ncbi:MAG TPA: SpoIID/LytB domain-containing protein [Vicinamibacteria bacterium]|nr:SpoIID/LytB domain-containing protein [Vicinamibacteria bacterium]